MWEVGLGVLTLLSVYLVGFILLRVVHIVTSDLKDNSVEMAEQTNINLNHVAEAIVGLSELLEEADQVIENISSVPTVGEILQQAVQGFIAQKLAPALPQPIQAPAKEIITSYADGVIHGKAQGQSKKKESSEIQEGV